jgi:arylsulfatase A-like enzyme
LAGGIGAISAPETDRPNFIIIFADDMGYGDWGYAGHPTIRTPNLERMAREGVVMTQFYTAVAVCSPSRASLLTGRYFVRTGVHQVLYPFHDTGLPKTELTLATLLKQRDYATACVGKWHLGHHTDHLPTSHGFDTYFGIPYSNDMDDPKRGDPPVPLMRDTKIIEQPCDQTTLTRRYTEESIKFINANKDGPFLLYLAHTMPHVPLFRSEEFADASKRGLYGDVVEEVDWSVGQLLQALK